MPHTAALHAEPARTGVAPAVARATLEPGTGHRWPALPIGAVVLGLNLIQLNRAAPWRDEAASWVSGQRSPAELLSMLGQVDAVHGVYYFLLYGWQGLLGDSILSLRLMSALAVGITAALVFLLARELFGARCAPWAGLLAGVLPPATWAAGEARSAAVSCAATAAAMLALAIALAGLDLWRPVFLARYLTFTVGATALVLGFAIGRLPRPWLRATATLFAIVALVPSLLQSREVYSKDTAFGAYVTLQRLARPGDGVLPLRPDTDQPFWAFPNRLAGLVDLGRDPDPDWRSQRLYPSPPAPAQVVTTAPPARIWLITKQSLPAAGLTSAAAVFAANGYRAGPPTPLSDELIAVLVERP